MARFGVRSGALAFADAQEDAARERFERTGANEGERVRTSLALAKAEGRGFESHHPL
jgi:hypothetical protein